MRDVAVPLGASRPIVNRQNGSDRERGDRFIPFYQIGIIRGIQLALSIALTKSLRGRYRQKMQPFLRLYRLEQASGFGRRVHQSRNLSSPEFVERQRLRKGGDLHTDP